MNEFEVIRYNDINGMDIFFNTVEYRTAHLHPEWELVWVIKNNLDVSCDSGSFVVKEGDFVLFSPSQVHEFKETAGGTTFLCLQILPSFINLKNSVVAKNLNPNELLSVQDCNLVKRSLVSLMKSYLVRGRMYRMFCAGMCNLIMFTILKNMSLFVLSDEQISNKNKRNERLTRLMKFVNDNYMHKIKLTDFAESEGVTMGYMSHLVKEAMNHTFQSYVNSVRFNHACRMIATGRYKMSEVFKHSGFSDYKYFSKTFKHFCSMTPEEYSRTIDSAEKPVSPQERSLKSSEKFFSVEESFELIKTLEKEMKDDT